MREYTGIAVVACLLCWPATSRAQTVEVTPFAGYRFGGGFFERLTGQPVDLDGAPAVGAVVNVAIWEPGLFAEALFTHQEARLTVPGGLFVPPANWRITVDHWQGGGLREFGASRRARPFLTGLLGSDALCRRGRQRDPVHGGCRGRGEADAGTIHRHSARRAGVCDVRGSRRAGDCLLTGRVSRRRRRRHRLAGRVQRWAGRRVPVTRENLAASDDGFEPFEKARHIHVGCGCHCRPASPWRQF